MQEGCLLSDFCRLEIPSLKETVLKLFKKNSIYSLSCPICSNVSNSKKVADSSASAARHQVHRDEFTKRMSERHPGAWAKVLTAFYAHKDNIYYFQLRHNTTNKKFVFY